jgi:aminoglycoside/choline kinase family phosphotransferase
MRMSKVGVRSPRVRIQRGAHWTQICLRSALEPSRQNLKTEHATPVDFNAHLRVLRLVGETLAALQRVAPDTVRGLVGERAVIVHGDFWPQNMLFDLEADGVTGDVPSRRSERVRQLSPQQSGGRVNPLVHA